MSEADALRIPLVEDHLYGETGLKIIFTNND